MSGLHEVDCSGCGRRHVTNGEQARKLRVLRCECGHFVRLDRALTERRSEPTPSFVDDERVSRPAQRDSSLPPAGARQRQASIAPSEKPLWYVDLGGTELVEMTIEQLIIARRTGKLGEGALVWREGMPSWRPVGTLIPAASASSHPAPLPSPSTAPVSAAIRTPVPTRTPIPKDTRAPTPSLGEATPKSLASYERPLATLEFALERPGSAPPLAPARAPFPSIDGQRPSRPPAPLSRASLASLASVSSPFSTPFPRPAQLPRVTALATPLPPARPSPPPPPPVSVATPSPIPVVTTARSSDRPNEQALANLQLADSLRERPRWVSACIALVVCVTASAAGASLVRSLKQQRPAQALPVSAASALSINVPAAQPATQLPPTASSAPLVVNLESLSVEHKRTVPRAVRVVPKPAPIVAAEGDDETPSKTTDNAPEAAASETPSSGELPAAARSNPYGSGSLIDQIKKATADEEAGQ